MIFRIYFYWKHAGLAVKYKCAPFPTKLEFRAFLHVCARQKSLILIDWFFFFQSWKPLVVMPSLGTFADNSMHKVSCFLLYTNGKMSKNRKAPYRTILINLTISKTEISLVVTVRGHSYCMKRKAVLLRVSSSHEFIAVCAHFLQFFPSGKKTELIF